MDIASSQLIALVVAGMLATTFGANEATHGSLAETMGLGHQHMLDYGGYHCAAHDHAELGPDHMEHMHGSVNGTGSHHEVDHSACPGPYDHMGPNHHDPYDGHMGGR